MGAEQGACAPALKKSEESLHSAAHAASCARQGWSAGCWIAWPAASSTNPSGAYVLPAHATEIHSSPKLLAFLGISSPQDGVDAVNPHALCQAPSMLWQSFKTPQQNMLRWETAKAASPVMERSESPTAGECNTATRATLIWLVVSVPVLSLQMTVVQPSVSTEGRLRAPKAP